MRMTKTQRAVDTLCEAFDGLIDLAAELHVDEAVLIEGRDRVLSEIFYACPEALDYVPVRLTNGNYILRKKIREHPDAFIEVQDGEYIGWAPREAANVVKFPE